MNHAEARKKDCLEALKELRINTDPIQWTYIQAIDDVMELIKQSSASPLRVAEQYTRQMHGKLETAYAKLNPLTATIFQDKAAMGTVIVNMFQ